MSFSLFLAHATLIFKVPRTFLLPTVTKSPTAPGSLTADFSFQVMDVGGDIINTFVRIEGFSWKNVSLTICGIGRFRTYLELRWVCRLPIQTSVLSVVYVTRSIKYTWYVRCIGNEPWLTVSSLLRMWLEDVSGWLLSFPRQTHP